MVAFLADPVVHQIMLTVHILAVSVGFGGATVTDVLFFRFLKDFLISHKEEEVMRILAMVVLHSMLVIIISGFLLYFSDRASYDANPLFWLKMVAVLIACINGLGMHLYLSPRLLSLSFALEHGENLDKDAIKDTRLLTRIAFAMGSISAVSWWTAFLVAMMKNALQGLHAPTLFGGFAAVLVIGVIVSQFIEISYARKKQSTGRLSRTWNTTKTRDP